MKCIRTNRLSAVLSLLVVAAICSSQLQAASVGDPEIKTNDTYFPGELAMSTPAKVLAHAYSIPRGSIGTPANDRERLIKLFLWRCEHYTHLTSPEVYNLPGVVPNPASDNSLMIDYDTMRQMFSYAWGLCGTNHGTMRVFADAAGWDQRRRGLNGDTGHEIFVDGAWRYVNTDQYTLHFLTNSATSHFASADQVMTTNHRYIEWNPDLGGGYFMPQAPTHGSYQTVGGFMVPSIPYRSLQWRDYYNNVWNLAPASSIKMYAEGYYSTPIVYRLKRGENFTRWLKPDGAVTDLGLAGRAWWGFNVGGSPHANWSYVQNAPARDQITSGAEQSQAGGGQDYGNGCYNWTPSLANGEYADGLASQTGTFVTGGSPVLRCTAAGSLVFEHFSPYTIAARAFTNNPAGKIDPAYNADSGAVLTTTSSGTITVDISVDSGATWTSLGNLTPSFDFTNSVKGRNHYLLRLNFATNAGLNTMNLRTLTMVSQAVYPNLKNGSTTVTYAAGNVGALELNPNLWDATAANSTTGYVKKVADSGNITGVYYSPGTLAYTAIGPAAISITYQITLPPSLVAQGASFKQIFAALDGAVHVAPLGGPYSKIEISTSSTGPWTSIGSYYPPADNDFSHHWTYGRSADGSNLGGTNYYVKYTTYNGGYQSGIRYLRLNATYNLPASTVPMDVTYHWNDGAAKSSTHTVAAGASSDSWTVNSTGLTAQNKVVFSVASGGVVAPTITTQPSNVTVTQPATATFTVVASGSGLTYQWKKGGAPIGGATSASYTTPATTTGDSGSIYTVDVTNAGGTVTSNNATLTVNAAGSPVITTQPANVTVTAPATATFTVVATGATSYQWKRNGTPIGGATSASYTTSATTVAGDNGAQFTVDVTNASGTVTSNIATLTVNAVAGPPVTVTFQEGAASYAGTTDTYLDQFNPANSYGTIDRVDVNWYDAGAGVVETTIGLLKFDLSSLPAGATITSASLDLWLTRTNSLSGSDTLVMNKVTANWTEASTYAGGIPASAPSGVATPSLATVPNFNTSPPTHQYTIPGLGTLVQGWYDIPASNFGLMFTFASNANFRIASSEYTTNAAERPKLTVTYTTGGGGPVPVITTQPANVTVTQPATATFTVVATGATSYQWKKNGGAIGGATSASYTTPATTTADNGAVYTVDVTNANGTTTSSNATLTVNAGGSAPTITTQPANQTVTQPATATFSVVATGATSYQWKKNGGTIGGATSASYTTPATTTADNGAVYTVDVTNGFGTTTSSNATLTVNASGNPISPSAGTLSFTATGGSVTPQSQTLTLTNTGGVSVTVTPTSSQPWLTTSGALTVGAGASGNMTVTINPTGLTGSNTATLTLTNSTGGSQTLTVNLTITGGGGNPVTPSVTTITLGAPTGSVTPVTTTISLTNTSGAAVTVTPSTVNAWLTTSGPVTIPAGATVTLVITGDPTGLAGANTGTLTLTNSTGGTQTLAVGFTVGTQTGLRKRSCAISNAANSDGFAWIFGLAALAALTLLVRRQQA